MIYRKIILYFTFTFILAGIFAQGQSINQYDPEGKKTGVWETYYDNGKIKSRGNFKQGHPAGEVLKYYPGGILQASITFDETGRTSYVKMYYEAGHLAAEGKYIAQKKDSVWNYYSSYDKRKAVSETYVSGQKNGVSLKFYQGEKPSEYQEWQNDQKHGKWEQYYENGQVRLTGYYNAGLLNGNFISYNSDGSFSIKGNYSAGAMDGTWVYYNEAGDQELSVEYVNGRMLPNAEVEKRIEEFSKKVKDSIGNLDEVEITEF